MIALFVLITLATAALAFRLLSGAAVRRRSVRMVAHSVNSDSLPLVEEGDGGRLAVWLIRAGYRDPSAPSIFVGSTAACLAFALTAVAILQFSGTMEAMLNSLSAVPISFVSILVFVAKGAAAIIVVIFASIPALVVRAARRARVEAIEQDLAPTLELLATLAEAGLGFDSAISRILDSATAARPLGREFQIYQSHNLGGVPRMASLRKLAFRIHLVSVSMFVSAIVQAEQIGASLAETLRIQSDDLRDRRKMRALILAQALPVKLVFPLMFCFLPSLFYSTLGPVIAEFVNLADSIIKR